MLLTLQNRVKWDKQQQNCKDQDVVTLKEDTERCFDIIETLF